MKTSKGYKQFVEHLDSVDALSEVTRIARRNYGVSLRQVYEKTNGKDRENVKHITLARAEVMTYLRLRFGWSLPILGKLFARHHTTVLHSLKLYEEHKQELLKARQDADAMVPKGKT